MFIGFDEVITSQGDGLKRPASIQLKSFFFSFWTHIQQSVAQDRIGFVIVFINAVYDTFLWVRHSGMGVDQKWAMILFNLSLACVFGLNKDLWSKMIKPFEKRTAQFLLLFLFSHRCHLHRISSTFLANFFFSFLVQSVRLIILYFHQLPEFFFTSDFWVTSLGLSALLSLTSFGWSEQLAEVDEVKNPIAKDLLRRFMEVRALAMGHLSPSGKLLQPDLYGLSPIVALVIHGILGLFMFINSQKITAWFEAHPSFSKVHIYHEHFDQFLAKLWKGLFLEKNRRSLGRKKPLGAEV